MTSTPPETLAAREMLAAEYDNRKCPSISADFRNGREDHCASTVVLSKHLREVSDAVEALIETGKAYDDVRPHNTACPKFLEHRRSVDALRAFILPKPAPDPRLPAVRKLLDHAERARMSAEEGLAILDTALDAAGLKIVEV